MTANKWYVTKRAIIEYTALMGHREPAVAEAELIGMLARAANGAQLEKRTHEGLLVVRGPRPLRLALLVADDETPQRLISVNAGNAVARQRDRRHNNPGRPVTVGADARLELRIPSALLGEVERAASAAGLDRSSWCRLAFEAALGRRVTFGG